MSDASFIAYYRVSTDQQGRSGLGLEAQRSAVCQFVEGRGGVIVAEFTEVESGKRSDRPALATALAECRRRKVTLVIAKLDRLARNVAFIARLMETGVPFLAVDMPTADRFMLHVYAAMAEEEARRISARTKAALAAAKARGVKLGQHCKELSARQIAEADAFAQRLAPTIGSLRAEGFTTVRALADELNHRNVPTAKGGRWHVPTVHHLLKRIQGTQAPIRDGGPCCGSTRALETPSAVPVQRMMALSAGASAHSSPNGQTCATSLQR